ncbi:MAG: GHKL domain-containing protein [Leptospiraceae bacterium]|nr:GHKL domain-containing protein [Leptospiraceae bacterium]
MKFDYGMPRIEFVKVWRAVFGAAALLSFVAYFAVDADNFSDPAVLKACLYVRSLLAIIALLMLSISYVRRRWIYRLTMAGHIYSILYYFFLSWLDSVAPNPENSRYYFGIFQVSIAVFAFRISLLSLANLILAIVIYSVFNFNSILMEEAIFDLGSIALLVWVVLRNFEITYRSEKAAKRREIRMRQQYQRVLGIIREIDHDLKPSILFMAKYAGMLKYKIKSRKDKEVSRMIQYYSWFIYNHFCNIIELTHKIDLPVIVQHGSSSLIRGIYRAIQAVVYRYNSDIEYGSMLISLRRVRIKSPHTVLVRIFGNVLENAVKYSPGVDPIEIRCERMTDQYVQITIKNKISDNIKIGESIFSDSSGVDGSGLGIPGTRRLMKAIGGEIAHEHSQQHAIVRLNLPLEQGIDNAESF